MLGAVLAGKEPKEFATSYKYGNKSRLHRNTVPGWIARYENGLHTKQPIERLYPNASSREWNAMLVANEVFGHDTLKVVDEPGKGRGVRALVNLPGNTPICHFGPVDSTKPESWEFDPNGITGYHGKKRKLCYVTPGLEYGPAINNGLATEAFATVVEAMARAPNVELKIEGTGRDRLGVIYTKAAGLKKGEWLSLYYGEEFFRMLQHMYILDDKFNAAITYCLSRPEWACWQNF